MNEAVIVSSARMSLPKHSKRFNDTREPVLGRAFIDAVVRISQPRFDGRKCLLPHLEAKAISPIALH
jgi:hypothetical protein